MEIRNLANELSSNSYPGRGIVIGKSQDGKNAVTAYFIMGRSENSRNRVFGVSLLSEVRSENYQEYILPHQKYQKCFPK